MAIIKVSDEDFTEKIKTGVSIVDFFADWCGPCKMMAPTFEKISNEYDGKANFYKINIDENEKTTANYGVMTIPTFIVFKDGEKVSSLVGVVDEVAIKTNLDQVI